MIVVEVWSELSEFVRYYSIDIPVEHSEEKRVSPHQSDDRKLKGAIWNLALCFKCRVHHRGLALNQ